MLQALASIVGRFGPRPVPVPGHGNPVAQPWPTSVEVERRRVALRDGVLEFQGAQASHGVRDRLRRIGYGLRVDDITASGVSAWAPVNAWALDPKRRREIWLVYRDRDDPWWSDAHLFATLDGVTVLSVCLMPTQLPGADEALLLRTRFGLVSTESEWIFADDAAARLEGRIPKLWHRPSEWDVMREGWLPAADAASVSGTLGGLVAGMVDTLERAGPALGLMARRAA